MLIHEYIFQRQLLDFAKRFQEVHVQFLLVAENHVPVCMICHVLLLECNNIIQSKIFDLFIHFLKDVMLPSQIYKTHVCPNSIVPYKTPLLDFLLLLSDKTFLGDASKKVLSDSNNILYTRVLQILLRTQYGMLAVGNIRVQGLVYRQIYLVVILRRIHVIFFIYSL